MRQQAPAREKQPSPDSLKKERCPIPENRDKNLPDKPEGQRFTSMVTRIFPETSSAFIPSPSTLPRITRPRDGSKAFLKCTNCPTGRNRRWPPGRVSPWPETRRWTTCRAEG